MLEYSLAAFLDDRFLVPCLDLTDTAYKNQSSVSKTVSYTPELLKYFPRLADGDKILTQSVPTSFKVSRRTVHWNFLFFFFFFLA